MLHDLIVGAITFHRQHATIDPQQRQAPLDDLVQGSDGSRRHRIQFPDRFADCSILGTTTYDGHVDLKFVDDFFQELGPAKQRFDQDHVSPRASERQWDPGEPRSTADIANSFAVSDQLTYSGAIHHVTIPEPPHFGRPEQSAIDSIAGEDLRVPLGLPDAVPEYTDGGVRWGWRFTMFHVKRPPRRNTAIELQLCN